jgi:hypothetical protein
MIVPVTAVLAYTGSRSIYLLIPLCTGTSAGHEVELAMEYPVGTCSLSTRASRLV